MTRESERQGGRTERKQALTNTAFGTRSGILQYQAPQNVEVSLDPCELPGRPIRVLRILQKHCQLALKGQRWDEMKEGRKAG